MNPKEQLYITNGLPTFQLRAILGAILFKGNTVYNESAASKAVAIADMIIKESLKNDE